MEAGPVTREHGPRAPHRGKSGASLVYRSHRVTGPAVSHGYDLAEVRCHVSIPLGYRLGLLVLTLSRLMLIRVTFGTSKRGKMEEAGR
jgi:hypothetical protein